MVSVATKFDAPIKVLFPRNIFDPESKHAMLGLGDIVIPGMLNSFLILPPPQKKRSLAFPNQQDSIQSYPRNNVV